MDASGGDLFGTKKGLAVLACLMSAPVAAQDFSGCYARTYSEAHLAAHPDQVVREIRVLLEPPEEGQVEGRAFVAASFADQGHVAGTAAAGQTLRQGIFCKPGDGWFCVAECDAGTARLSWQKEDVLRLSTEHLTIGDLDDCGGPVDLAERAGAATVYLLHRKPQSDCGDLVPE